MNSIICCQKGDKTVTSKEKRPRELVENWHREVYHCYCSSWYLCRVIYIFEELHYYTCIAPSIKSVVCRCCDVTRTPLKRNRKSESESQRRRGNQYKRVGEEVAHRVEESPSPVARVPQPTLTRRDMRKANISSSSPSRWRTRAVTTHIVPCPGRTFSKLTYTGVIQLLLNCFRISVKCTMLNSATCIQANQREEFIKIVQCPQSIRVETKHWQR